MGKLIDEHCAESVVLIRSAFELCLNSLRTLGRESFESRPNVIFLIRSNLLWHLLRLRLPIFFD